MAKGFWITVYRSVQDAARLAEYSALAVPALEAAGGRILARGIAARTFEGEGGRNERTVVVEFESVARAVAAYESPRYQAAAKLLAGAVDREVRIVEGVA